MNQSESIAALAAALSKAQSAITGALKDSANPFFKSKYADLASCWDACRKPLTDNELAVIQTIEATDYDRPRLVTTLAHSSGEWIKSFCPILTKDSSAQGQGSGITYARRQSLAAIVGLAQIDDDGEASLTRGKKEPTPDTAQKVAGCKTLADLTALFQSLPEAERASATAIFAARKKEII